MAGEATIRAFVPADAEAVRDLFIRVNRLLAPPHLEAAFEDYITLSLREEIGRIADYYRDKNGSFWVATIGGEVIGMFGLERPSRERAEIRRMYVDPAMRRSGIARKMLQFAEEECRRTGVREIELSTSELQQAALALYRSAGYRETREEIATAASVKTIGGGIRRYHFTKRLA
jgi:putative acetyltransferase